MPGSASAYFGGAVPAAQIAAKNAKGAKEQCLAALASLAVCLRAAITAAPIKSTHAEHPSPSLEKAARER